VAGSETYGAVPAHHGEAIFLDARRVSEGASGRHGGDVRCEVFCRVDTALEAGSISSGSGQGMHGALRYTQDGIDAVLELEAVSVWALAWAAMARVGGHLRTR
jgi:hypothetical protein